MGAELDSRAAADVRPSVLTLCTGIFCRTQLIYGYLTQTLNDRATVLPGLWVVGSGRWTGFASATLMGWAGRCGVR